MALSAPRVVYGVHSISPYSRTTKEPYGILKVVGSANFAFSSSLEQLYGGSNKYPWAAEGKTISTELTAKVKAYPGFLFNLFLGATVTDNAAETAGSVTTLTNFYGTSCKSATIGIASVALTSAASADVKFGKFVVKVVSATTVDVYMMSDVDQARGADFTYASDLLKITASPLTVTTSAVHTAIPNTGIDLVGGSSTIGMTTGDTATFSTRPINTASADIVIGATADTIPAFGAVLLAQKRETGEMFEIEVYHCVGVGMPIPLDEFAFSVTELKAVCLYDTTALAVAAVRTVTPTTVI